MTSPCASAITAVAGSSAKSSMARKDNFMSALNFGKVDAGAFDTLRPAKFSPMA
jgi:hypothetical protein